MSLSTGVMRNYCKEMWAISDEDSSDIVPIDECIPIENTQVFMLWFPVNYAISKSATNFGNAFNREYKHQMYAEALLQLHFMCMNEYRNKHKNTDDKTVTYTSDPIRAYVEVVTKEVPLDDYESMSLDGNDSEEQSTVTSVPSERVFMHNVPDKVEVTEYRLWIFVLERESQLDYGSMMRDIIERTGKNYEKFTSGGKKEAGEVDMSQYMGQTGSSPEYGKSLGDIEKYKLIHNLETYCHAVDSMIGIQTLTDKRRAEEVHGRGNWSQNPAHPARVFSPHLYFDHVPTAEVDLVQRQKPSYFVGGFWKFPKPDHVVQLNHANQKLHTFTKKLLPDYQARYYDVGALQKFFPKKRKRTRAIARVAPVCDVSSDFFQQLQHDQDDDEIDVYNSEDPVDDNDDGAAPDAELPLEQTLLKITVPMATGGEYILYDASYLDRQDFEDSNSLAARSLLSPDDSPSRSAFHRLRFEGVMMQKVFQENVASGTIARSQLRKQYQDIQNALITRYADQCMRSTSDISDIGKKMNEWFELREEAGNGWLGEERPIIYNNLSTFGNMLGRILARLETSMFVSTAHGLALLFVFGSRDAYRHAIGDLHFNGIVFGPHSASKSFILTLIKLLSISGTVIEGLKGTKNSNFVDTDNNDVIIFCEEAPLGMLTDDTKKINTSEDTEETDFKELLTSQVARKRVFIVHVNGRRDSRFTYRQMIHTYFMATNALERQISHPIASRFHTTTVHNRVRQGRSIKDLIGVEKRLDEAGKERRSKFIDQMHCLQFLIYHTEKLIAIQALRDINLTVFNACKHTFVDFLDQRYLIDVEARDVQRMELIVRQFVMATALEYLYSNPVSPHYKKEFDVRQLADLDPLLHDSEEIVYFVFSLMRDQFISRNEHVVLRVIRSHYFNHKIVIASSDNKRIFLTPSTCISRQQFKQRAVFPVSVPQQSSANTAVAPQTAKFMYPAHYMFSYLQLHASHDEVKNQLVLNLKDSSDKIDRKDINNVLQTLYCGTIRGHSYAWNDDLKLPQRTNACTKPVPAAFKTENGVFIHLDLLQTNVDPVDEAIRACYHTFHTRPREYLDGIEIDAQHPHLFRTRILLPEDGHPQSYVDHAKVVTKEQLLSYDTCDNTGNINHELQSGITNLTTSYDQLALDDRAQSLFLPHSDANMSRGKCSWKTFEEKARVQRFDGSFVYKSARAIDTYPDDLLSNISVEPPLSLVDQIVYKT